jgi:hypothetical protein
VVDLIRYIKESICNFRGAEKERLYELPDGQFLTLCPKSVQAPELLFKPSLCVPWGQEVDQAKTIASESRQLWTLAAKHQFGMIKDMRRMVLQMCNLG